MSIYRVWFICVDMRIALTSWPSSRHCFALVLSERWEMVLFAFETDSVLLELLHMLPHQLIS